MRGEDHQQSHVFSYLSPEERVRPDHPLRAIGEMVDVVLSQLSRSFDSMYAKVGRPSIAPEKLLRAQLLQIGSCVIVESVKWTGSLPSPVTSLLGYAGVHDPLVCFSHAKIRGEASAASRSCSLVKVGRLIVRHPGSDTSEDQGQTERTHPVQGELQARCGSRRV